MYYFAYGSNLYMKQMKERCPHSKPLFVAYLPNYRLVFAGWSEKWGGGVATIKSDVQTKVVGAVYELTPDDLNDLDKYEKCPEVYIRNVVRVSTQDQDEFNVITYMLKDEPKETLPSDIYLDTIKRGYEDWGIINDPLFPK